GAHLPAAVVPAEHLRLRLLGAPDDRRPYDRPRGAPRPAAAVRPRRAPDRAGGPAAAAHLPRARPAVAGQGRSPVRAQAASPASAPRDEAGRALGARPAGGRRLLGRDPAALGLLAHGAVPARPRRRRGPDQERP